MDKFNIKSSNMSSELQPDVSYNGSPFCRHWNRISGERFSEPP